MNKPTVFFDMDGVIADFEKGYKQFFNRDVYKDDAFTVNQFVLTFPNFFRVLPVLDKGMELLNALKDEYNIVFLTTPMEGIKECRRDKVDWIRQHIGPEYDVIFSDKKEEYAVDEKSVLIDDMKYNLEPWSENGGTAIDFRLKNEKILEIIDGIFNDQTETKDVQKQLDSMVVEETPTEKQKESGIYAKGKLKFKGLDIRIENPKGSVRWGFGEDGKKWVNRMRAHYGYIVGSEGADYDPVDVFIGPKLGASRVFAVNQNTEDGRFDETKFILGCENMDEARKLYLSNYQRGWETRIDSIVQLNTKKLREWLKSGNKMEPFK